MAGGRIWDAWEKEALKYLVEFYTFDEIGGIIGRTWNQVRNQAHVLGVNQRFIGRKRRSPARKWMDEDKAAVREMAEYATPGEIARRYGVSKKAISILCSRIGVVIKHRIVYDSVHNIRRVEPCWGKHQRNELYARAGVMRQRDAARELGKSVSALRKASIRQGIRWDQGRVRVNDVAKRLQVHKNTVIRHRRKLRQHWGTFASPRSPTQSEVQAIARSIYEDPRSHTKGSLLNLRRIAYAKIDDETSIETPNFIKTNVSPRNSWCINKITLTMAKAIAKEQEAAE